MQKIKLGGQEFNAAFTNWSVREFYRLTDINLYERSELRKVFKSYSEEEPMTSADFERVAKFAYCAFAAGCMPINAAPDWAPPFTWEGILNLFTFKDHSIYAELIAVYYGEDLQSVLDRVAKNQEAPQSVGQQ
jgi:hypothetical protein